MGNHACVAVLKKITLIYYIVTTNLVHDLLFTIVSYISIPELFTMQLPNTHIPRKIHLHRCEQIASKMNTESNDYKFQEFCRVSAATASKYDKEGLLNGKWILQFIQSQLQLVKGFISQELYSLITQELELSQGKDNVREHVKRILTFPLQGYLPWILHTVNTEEVAKECANFDFHFTIKNG